ncbi:HAD family hydrolase, partial [Ruminococcaceae bacterium OttesenSCG-928-D13]|nr:HAD family hydrolase [Ruminococcaceae bacterium OttesenSCG-928-D13]
VIGEVGPDGVELGSETPAGLAFAEFQGYLALLKSRGILLNVASKNEEANAAAGFERADSPLKKDDFLCFEANWEAKSGSLKRIAETLNIGVDSLVFTDDNPAERAEVTGVLPAVEAPPVDGGAPENSIRLLDRGGYFEVSALSADDAARNAMYKENAQRARAEATAGDYDSYLKSLEMTAEIGPFTPAHAERITQLINKTNQFNLTTRRYTAAEVDALMADPAVVTLSGRLVDKFGDNGLTTALIGRVEGDALDIELWIMSCRVFKRQLEYALFDALVATCKKRGITAITGSWLSTAKNLLVKDFYATIGFDLVDESAAERRFRFTIPADYTAKNSAIKLV